MGARACRPGPLRGRRPTTRSRARVRCARASPSRTRSNASPAARRGPRASRAPLVGGGSSARREPLDRAGRRRCPRDSACAGAQACWERCAGLSDDDIGDVTTTIWPRRRRWPRRWRGHRIGHVHGRGGGIARAYARVPSRDDDARAHAAAGATGADLHRRRVGGARLRRSSTRGTAKRRVPRSRRRRWQFSRSSSRRVRQRRRRRHRRWRRPPPRVQLALAMPNQRSSPCARAAGCCALARRPRWRDCANAEAALGAAARPRSRERGARGAMIFGTTRCPTRRAPRRQRRRTDPEQAVALLGPIAPSLAHGRHAPRCCTISPHARYRARAASRRSVAQTAGAARARRLVIFIAPATLALALGTARASEACRAHALHGTIRTRDCRICGRGSARRLRGAARVADRAARALAAARPPAAAPSALETALAAAALESAGRAARLPRGVLLLDLSSLRPPRYLLRDGAGATLVALRAELDAAAPTRAARPRRATRPVRSARADADTRLRRHRRAPRAAARAARTRAAIGVRTASAASAAVVVGGEGARRWTPTASDDENRWTTEPATAAALAVAAGAAARRRAEGGGRRPARAACAQAAHALAHGDISRASERAAASRAARRPRARARAAARARQGSGVVFGGARPLAARARQRRRRATRSRSAAATGGGACDTTPRDAERRLARAAGSAARARP